MTRMNLGNTATARGAAGEAGPPLNESATTANQPAVTRVVQVELRTANLERALAFYQGVLGFKPIKSPDSTVALSASAEPPAIVVLREDRAAAARPARATGLYHLAIRYPTRRDLAGALQRLARNRYGIQGASDHIVSEAIYLADPDQNGVELYADRPRDQWAWHNGQVQMSTEPLDLEDLMATLEGERDLLDPPPQTDLGHIHLHVADLAQAERFYHDFLGLDVTQRSYPGALFFAAGGYHHHIAVNTWAGKTSPPENSVGLVSYRLEVPSKEMLLALQHRAAVAAYEVQEGPAGGASLLRFRDPNGNWLEITPAQAG